VEGIRREAEKRYGVEGGREGAPDADTKHNKTWIRNIGLSVNRGSSQSPSAASRVVWGEATEKAKPFVLRILSLLVFCFLFSVTGYTQRLSAKLDRDKIVLGEQVTLELKLDGLDGNSTFITSWFNLPDTINHIQVIKRDTVDTIEVNGLTSYLQHITVTSFDSGRWAIPLQKLIIQNKANGKQTGIRADSVFLQVLPVDVSGLKDYHDIKDIIDVPVKTDYTLIIAGIVSGIVVMVLIILLAKRKKKPAKPARVPTSKLNPLNEALQNIDALKKEGLPAKGQTKLFYTRLDDIWRAYFNMRANIQSMQSTSDELMIKLGVYLQDRDMKTTFYQLLRLSDAVKFAKYQPTEQQNEEALKQAAACLRHIEKQIQIANGHII